MVERHLEIEEVSEKGISYIKSGNQGPVLRRDPSFSRWCDEDGIVCSGCQLENAEAGSEDSDFELPLLQKGELENTVSDKERYQHSKFEKRAMQPCHGNTLDGASIHGRGRGNETYVPFDIEDKPERDIDFSNIVAFGSNSKGNHEMSLPNSSSSIDIVGVLKTFFFIIVWYASSTILTL